MNESGHISNDERIDYVISFAVFIQSFLVILQQTMIMAFGMEAEATAKYRVILTAIPMGIAILMSFFRRPKLFIKTYFWIILILLLNMSFSLNNFQYLVGSLHLLLPVVIPSALCLMSVRSLEYVEKALLHISWGTFFLIVFFVLRYLKGTFLITDYSMPFSYGCLLPMAILYRQRNWISLVMSFAILFVVLAIGCRGAAIVFLVYVVYDTLVYNRKYIIWLIAILVSFLYFFPVLVHLLDSLGASSRTLNMLVGGNFLGYNSGRDDLYSIIIDKILENPFGLGLFADRYFLDGTYCHNLILEILVDWGVIVGGISIIVFFIYFLKKLFILNETNQNRLVCYFTILCMPLMVSNSYLISYDFGAFLGMFYLTINDDNLYSC